MITFRGGPNARPRSRAVGDRARAGLALLAAGMTAAAAGGQTFDEQTPEPLQDVDIVEHLDARLPLDLPFVDSAGRPVTLGDYFEDGKPVIITLNYYGCPMLCTLQLNGFLKGLKELEWTLGEKFRVVTVSFDPTEGPELAAGKQKGYLQAYGRDGGYEDDWVFLTGEEPAIRRLTETIGFSYEYVPETGEWAHGTAVFVATPEGRLSRYLYGVAYPPEDLRFALLEASDGKIGSVGEKFLLWCYHYDEQAGQYTADVMKIVRAFGVLMVTALGTTLVLLWRHDLKKRRADAAPSMEFSS